MKETWPEVVLLLGYAALNEIRAWRIARQTSVVRQAVGKNTKRVRDVEAAVASAHGRPLLRRRTDHDEQDEDPPVDPGR